MTTLLKVKAGYLIRVVRLMYVPEGVVYNSLVVNEERMIKMMDGSGREVIGTRTVKVTKRDKTVCTLEAVLYVPEAR